MRWKIELERAPEDSRLTRDLLKALDLDVLQEDGKFFIVGGAIEPARTAREAWASASQIAASLNHAGEYQPSLNLHLSISSLVHEQRGDGEWGVHSVITVSPAVGYVQGGSVVFGVGASGSEEDVARRAAELCEQQYQARLQVGLRRMLSARRSPDALKVQRLLVGDLTPHVMGVISDLLMQGKKEGYRYRYAPKRLWSRFDNSINAPEVMGDSARHGGLSPERMKHIVPMQLADAQAFIREASERFLAEMAGQPIPPFAP